MAPKAKSATVKMSNLWPIADNMMTKYIGIVKHLQDNGAVPLWGRWSSSGSHHGRHYRSVWCQSRRKQPQSSSTGIYTQGSLFHAWSTSDERTQKILGLGLYFALQGQMSTIFKERFGFLSLLLFTQQHIGLLVLQMSYYSFKVLLADTIPTWALDTSEHAPQISSLGS